MHTLHGTAIGLPISWGGAMRVFLGRQSYGSPIRRVWEKMGLKPASSRNPRCRRQSVPVRLQLTGDAWDLGWLAWDLGK